ncbi:hypothetical protein [Streptomyces sp. NPDC051567]|uniref:hypothetical protein n=1 Tax=Streptomyces sp. NPDC051567 TaxID=3365660 RepID=UPI0037BD4AA1
MASPESTETVPGWHFTLHAQEPLTQEQCDVLAGLDSFADGYVSLMQTPDVESSFVCYFEADSLMDAMKRALARFDDLPGVLIRSIELDACSFDHNGLATASVVPLAARPRASL